MLRRRRRLAGELNQSWMDRNAEQLESFWTKRLWLYYTIIGAAISIMLSVFVVFPVFIYTSKIRGLTCHLA